MTENKILELEFGSRSEAAGKLIEQQSDCLDHEIQPNLQPTKSYEIRWNLGLRKPQGIRVRPTAPRSPWQNAYVERLIGSIRRECLDHLIIIGEAHLRRVLRAYADYYNRTRTHLSLNKDTPLARPILREGRIKSIPHLGGLHHSYVRM